MKHIVIFGAGGHGRVVLDIIEGQFKRDLGAFVIAMYDTNKELLNIGDYPVVHTDEELEAITNGYTEIYGIIGIGDNNVRKRITEHQVMPWYKAIHPSATIADDVKIGEGTVVMAGVVINCGAVIGKHCIINTGTIIEHDCVIEDYVHLSPGVKLAGGTKVRRLSHVGIGAAVIPGVEIGEECTIGAGAVLIKDAPSGSTVVGVPGRVIK